MSPTGPHMRKNVLFLPTDAMIRSFRLIAPGYDQEGPTTTPTANKEITEVPKISPSQKKKNTILPICAK